MENRVGFVTVVESAEAGLIGGLLLLNQRGRPLEFHCTAPIKPSRAHEILYGPTLRPYLLGECMTTAMLAKVKRAPELLLTDLPEILAARAELSALTLLLESSGSPGAGEAVAPLQTETDLLVGTRGHWEGYGLEAQSAEDLQTGLSVLDTFLFHSLDEPFERIREALAEAEKAARPAGTLKQGAA